VGLFFREGGFREWKTLAQHLLINGEKLGDTTHENWKKDLAPKDWKKIKDMCFPS
jgi:hypothetical protein